MADDHTPTKDDGSAAWRAWTRHLVEPMYAKQSPEAGRCFWCGARQWSSTPHHIELRTVSPFDPDEDPDHPRVHNARFIACNNCGWMMLFFEPIVDPNESRWWTAPLRAVPPVEGDGE